VALTAQIAMVVAEPVIEARDAEIALLRDAITEGMRAARTVQLARTNNS
jgi:hypothetical protein